MRNLYCRSMVVLFSLIYSSIECWIAVVQFISNMVHRLILIIRVLESLLISQDLFSLKEMIQKDYHSPSDRYYCSSGEEC